MNAATRDRIIGLLIDEAYDRAIAQGHVIRHADGWRNAHRERVLAQAHEHPGWLESQADRLIGQQTRPRAALTCPACGIAVAPHDAEVTRGADGLAYCRPSCAAGEPSITLAEYRAANPGAALTLLDA